MRGEYYIYSDGEFMHFCIGNDAKRIAYNEKKHPMITNRYMKLLPVSPESTTSHYVYKWWAKPLSPFIRLKATIGYKRALWRLKRRTKNYQKYGREANSIALPMKETDEFVVMRYAQLTQQERVEAEQRACSKYEGNFGCDPLLEKYGQKTSLELLLEAAHLIEEHEAEHGPITEEEMANLWIDAETGDPVNITAMLKEPLSEHDFGIPGLEDHEIEPLLREMGFDPDNLPVVDPNPQPLLPLDEAGWNAQCPWCGHVLRSHSIYDGSIATCQRTGCGCQYLLRAASSEGFKKEK